MYNKKLLIGIGLFVLVCVIVICAIFYSSSEKKGNKTSKQRTEQTSTEQTPTEQTSADVSSPIDANDAETNFLTGKKYYDGDGVPRNYSTAVTYFRAAAEKGHAKAQYNLGICYYNGHGVERNYTEAIRYFKMSAGQPGIGEIPFKANMQIHLNNKNHDFYARINDELNGATISKIELIDFAMTSGEYSQNINVYTIRVHWSGKYYASGNFDVRYECNVSADTETYKSHRIVQFHNPSITLIARALAIWGNEYVSNRDCDIRKLIEKIHDGVGGIYRCTVHDAEAVKIEIETKDGASDSGINFSNVSKILLCYRFKWSAGLQNNGVTERAYLYDVLPNAELRIKESGITYTNAYITGHPDIWVPVIKTVVWYTVQSLLSSGSGD